MFFGDWAREEQWEKSEVRARELAIILAVLEKMKEQQRLAGEADRPMGMTLDD